MWAVILAFAALSVGLAARWLVVQRTAAVDAAHQATQVTREAMRALIDYANGEYTARSHVREWESKHQRQPHQWTKLELLLIPRELLAKLEEAEAFLQPPYSWLDDLNAKFADERITAEKTSFDNVGGFPLSPQQRLAVVRNENVNLVVAGAGAGKTATMAARVQYLVERGLARPDEILVVCFGKKAAAELGKRLTAIGVQDVEASTTHALGLRIIGEVDGAKPPVSPLGSDDIAARALIQERIDAQFDDPAKRASISAWFTKYLYVKDPVDECQTGAEYYARIREMGLRTLTGERLNSLQEVKIANWLAVNGYDWEYEAIYPHSPADKRRKKYTPDFVVRDRKRDIEVWIEHFGINSSGGTAPWVEPVKYKAGMEWKRNQHREHGTVLIQTYSYDDYKGQLLSSLEAQLRANGLPPRALTQAEAHALRLTSSVERSLSELSKLLLSFLRLYKGSMTGIAALHGRCDSEREAVFLKLFDDVLAVYEARLRDEEKIDFDDMLAQALEHCSKGRFRGPWRHILVDEFQDTSRLRLALLIALRDQHPHGHLFCVGDDWQSIFRFAGADVTLFTGIDEHAGFAAKTHLDRTYRSSQPLVNLSSHFVTRNPNQLTKKVQSHASHRPPAAASPALICFHAGKDAPGLKVLDAIDLCLQDVVGQMRGQKATVLFLGRYTRERPQDLAALSRKWQAKNIDLSAMTVHKAKGQETDFVIVLGNKSGLYGFPSGITDDPVLRLVLASPDQYANAEERRLFYVALTRARRRTYLLADKKHPSSFIQEILEYDPAFGIEQAGEVSERYRCPLCQGKTILRRSGRYGSFWSCMNWPGCDGKLRTCSKCEQVPREPAFRSGVLSAFECGECGASSGSCPSCTSGELMNKSGRYGSFLGCSNWLHGDMGCGYTRKLGGRSRQRR